MITKITHLDTCHPDYFLGFGGLVLCVIVDNKMTYTELRQTIDDESQAGDFGIDDWAGFEKALDDLFAEVADMEAKAFPKLDDIVDDDDTPSQPCPMAYFGVHTDG